MPKPFSSKGDGFCSFLTQEILWLILIRNGGRISLGDGGGGWACGFLSGSFMCNPGEKDLALVS